MISYKNLMKYAAIAALGTVALTGIARQAHAQAAAAAQPETHYKDQMEFDAFNAVTIDITKKDWAKALTDLDTWKQKYPDSWYKDTRTRLYIQPYFEQKKFDKVLEVAGEESELLIKSPLHGQRCVYQASITRSVKTIFMRLFVYFCGSESPCAET